MVLPIVSYDAPVLRQKAPEVVAFDAALRAVAQDLLDTLAATDIGIGLAAQQIGRAVRVCVVDLRGIEEPDFTYRIDGATPPVQLFMPLVLVNPKVSFPPGEKSAYEEGCLSFPKLRGTVIRQEAVRVEFQDLGGSRHELECDGLFGRCIQHELDHLDGILFIDRMERAVRSKLSRQIKELAARAAETAGQTPA